MVDNSYNPAETPNQLSDTSHINQQPDKNSEEIRRTIEAAAEQVRTEEWFSTEEAYIDRLKKSNQNVEQLLQRDPNAVQNISKQQFEEHSKNHDQYMLEQAAQKIESAALPPPSQRIDSIGSLQAYLADGDQELAKTLREYGSHIGESRVNSAFENRFHEFREKRSAWQKSEIIKAVDRTKLAETAYESEEKFFKALTEADPELEKALDGLMNDEKKQLLQETEVKDKIKASLTDFQNKKTLEKKDGLAGVDQKKLLAEAVETVGKNLPKKERHFSTEKEYLAALQEQNPQLQKLLAENPRLLNEKRFMNVVQTRFEAHDEAHNTLQKQKVLSLVQSVPFPSPEQSFDSQADFLQYLERSNPRLSKLLTDYGNHIFAGEVASAVGQKLNVHNARHTNHVQKEARSLVSKTELPDEIEVSDASKLLSILAEKNPQLKSLFAQNSDTLQNDAEIQNLLLQKLTTLKAQSKKETEQEAAPDYSEALQKSVEMFADSKSDIYGSYDEAFAAYRRTLTSETLKSAATQEKAFLIAELQKHPATIFVVDAATKAVLQKTNGALIEQAGFRSYPDRIAAASVLQALAKSPPSELQELDIGWLQKHVSADVATRFAGIAGGTASTGRVLQAFAKNVWGTNTIPDAAKSAQAEEEVAEAPEESDQNPELQSYLLKNNTKQFLERQGRNTTETHNALAGVFSLVKKYRFDKITLAEMMRSNSDIIAARHQLEAATGWNFVNHKEKYATLFALLNTTWSPYLVSLDASKTALPTNDADRHLLQQEAPDEKPKTLEKSAQEELEKESKSESLLLASQEVETAEEEIAENEESTVSLQKSGELQTEELQATNVETPEQTPSAISQSIGADLESFLDKQAAKDRERDDKKSTQKEEAKVQPEATKDVASEINLIEEKDATAKANEEADLIDLSAQEENPAEDEEAEQTTTEAASVPEKSQEEEEEEKLEEKTVAVLPEDSSADLLEAPENKSIFQESTASPVVKKDVVESKFPNEDAEFQSPKEEQAESADFTEIDSREEIIETSAKEEKNTENILVENKEADDDLELEELISITSVPKSETEENVAEKELKGSEDEPPQQEEIIEEKEESEQKAKQAEPEKSARDLLPEDTSESQETIEKEEFDESTAENTNENLPEVDADIVEAAADNVAEEEAATAKGIKEEVENEPPIELDTSLETGEVVESEEEEEAEGIEAKAAGEVVESEEEE